MDLRSKLARLDTRGRTANVGSAVQAVAQPAPPTPAAGVQVPATGDAAEPPPDKLSDLRARLSELITRSRAKHGRKIEERRAEIEARLREAPLPFDEHDTALGPLHVRRVHHPSSHCVGRVPIRLASEAHAAPLALLALDPSLGDADPRGALYLDTEATGLAGGTGTIPFLVGLAWFERSEGGADDLVVEQLLLRRLGDEAPMLARVADRIAAASMLVSFNGKAFDMPLLRTRFVMNRLAPPTERPHLDLVHVARRVHRAARGKGGVGDPRSGPTIERWTEEEELKRATSCKLVALERQILGFARVDDVPSAEVPSRYSHFLRTGDADAIRAVCDHNLWDVVSMAALIGVYADAVRGLDDDGTRELPHLGGRDLVGIAKTLRRAGDLPRARRAADAAVDAALGVAREDPRDDDRAEDRRADPDLERIARKTRGGIAKGARDTETALHDFGVLAAAHDDKEARLELAKLYEHRVRDPERALEHTVAGTAEPPEAAARRRTRLERKIAAPKQSSASPAGMRPRKRKAEQQLELPPSKLRRS
ncbi:MAG: ribonuclease H-like domain-containing protein [Deltaproteobacteria bacterium]|nr:ribonuclease H-like domain-containing protein [Deltaproteobacteria bacterium]